MRQRRQATARVWIARGFLALCVWAIAARVPAQLVATRDGPIVYGHHHFNATSVAEHTRFWTALGGIPITRIGSSPANVFAFQNVFVFVNERAPTGGMTGTSVNHVGFTVPNVRVMLDRVAAAGYPIVTKAEVPASFEVKNEVAFNPDLRVYIGYVRGPDSITVEFVQDEALGVPITLDHVHFATPRAEEVRAWYVKVFSARPEKQGAFDAAVLPGVSLRFAPSVDPVVPTEGRALDHIGFEVKDLERFCKELESRGVVFARPFARFPERGTANALLKDPLGTSVEVTEGLDRIPTLIGPPPGPLALQRLRVSPPSGR